MNIENLKEYRALEKEIKMLRQKIDRLSVRKYKFGVDTVSSSSRTVPYAKRPVTIMGYGFDASKDYAKARLIKECRERLKDRSAKFGEIQAFIDSIGDSTVRQIVEYKYIDGLSWLNIAFKIGSTSESTPRTIVKRFFNKN